jgi:hypothetical protein
MRRPCDESSGVEYSGSVLTTLLKYSFVMAFFLFFAVDVHSQTREIKDSRWKYICYDINEKDTKYYYDTETINYISTNQVDVWLKIASPKTQQILLVEISCASNMFHLIESPFDMWNKRVKTQYIAGNWKIIPPDSEVYLLSKLICK